MHFLNTIPILFFLMEAILSMSEKYSCKHFKKLFGRCQNVLLDHSLNNSYYQRQLLLITNIGGKNYI